MYLEKINAPEDVRQLNTEELRALAEEMRQALLFRLSRHGGHFGPNFGMVEATIALHYVFDSPRDKIVYDVSHQSYPHKMLTGRKNAYLSEEHFEDVSGYTNPEESEHDFFNVGHTSTSVSLASGLAKARDLKGEDGNVIAVIGDGSLSGGEALEGLDFAGEMHSNFIVVINDNDMSIAENHGGLYRNLKLLRDTDGKAECNLFRAMGLDYVFVKDGNDIEALIAAFRQVKDSKTPVAVHIVTQKGKGYALAEQHKEEWHWHLPFDIATGKTTVPAGGEKDYDTVTAEYLLKKMQEDASVCAITSATPTVFGFTKELRERAGKQFIDVGIAEEHAAAMASGIAKNGGKPFWGVYSSFLQRTYDQISQDICINQNAVTIAVYTASVYGMNDVTHLGIYDIPMISNIPNLVYLAPVTAEDYLAMLDWSLEQTEHPVAIRVPIQYISDGKPVTKDFGDLNRYEMTQEGSEIAIVALGSFYPLGVAAAEKIAQKTGITPTLINPYYITGLDTDCLEQLKKNHRVVLTLEDGVLDGGFGEKIARFYGDSKVRTKCFGLKKEFLDRYEVSEVLRENHLTAEQIAEDAVTMLAE
ncbi:1-deoxy-D-xylulose-5-phosphate synthase [Ruminococcus callidus]|uniref:1-deoxy-D-xylulose-5-phosphate synthase n=1 Tax=Ruminococcus callidus TaxID=40519 RepID=UPI001D0045CE|nr:1-deoxy-D-xylulose-5-phosphate synthase [Ruminococcus callidus]MCB5774393.1 1-deoxy-D-xylulose-5-phosphate synthase [Ruminococcus callidus]MCC2758088.1 1-deoxy-D-xylulose-5-phosphate synthase [Ruminococcus callidus]